jgi:hypothetical protein
MEPTERLTTVKYRDQLRWDLEQYFKKCSSHGFKNNASAEAIKLDWCLDLGGQFFLTYADDQVVSVSGCHPLPELGEKVYRILFRGATLPQYQNFLNVVSKTHMNSITFLHHVPKEIDWAKEVGYTKFVVTTNWDNPEIPSMNKSHRTFKLLERQGIVKCLEEKIKLFYTDQTVWELNVDRYQKVRKDFVFRNNSLDG